MYIWFIEPYNSSPEVQNLKKQLFFELVAM